MADGVRYRKNGDNGILKLALYEAYRTRCYWCRKPQSDHAAVQIDHIVPAFTEPGDIAKWVPAHRVQGYDLDAVYNLAPICPPCNLRKSNHDVSDYPVIVTALSRASTIQAEVVRQVKFFEGPTAVKA